MRTVRAGFVVGDRLASPDRLVNIFRGAGGGRAVVFGGAGGGRAALRVICFCFGAVKAGGKGGGSGALGGAGATLTTRGFSILRGWTVAILGGGGTMAAGILRIDGGGGGFALGFVTAGGLLAGWRRTTLFLVVGVLRCTAFLAGLRLVRRLVAVGGVRTSRLLRARLLGFTTGNRG